MDKIPSSVLKKGFIAPPPIPPILGEIEIGEIIEVEPSKNMTGDVIEPENNIMAIGSGGSFAQAAAIALMQNTKLDAATIAEKSLEIAGEICIYTNDHITIEKLAEK